MIRATWECRLVRAPCPVVYRFSIQVKQKIVYRYGRDVVYVAYLLGRKRKEDAECTA
jgi:hypothetical protein